MWRDVVWVHGRDDDNDIRHLGGISPVPADDTQRIQEVQLLVIHLLCELVEERLFSQQWTDPVVHAAPIGEAVLSGETGAR